MKNLLVCIIISITLCSKAATVTNLSGSFRHGQVFLTWQNTTDSTSRYKVYRSVTPITSGSQLSGCEYLGYTDSHSSQDWNLTRQDGIKRYLRIDSAGTPLSPATGLFVATTLVNGNYYYAVTVLIGGVETQTIIVGSNALSSPLTETISTPRPVFQEERIIHNESVQIYSTFLSTKYAVDKPLMNKAGFLPFDFGVYKNHGDSPHPLEINLHGGSTYFLDRITTTTTDEIMIGVEDDLPSGANQAWFGVNENYDIYDSHLNTTTPATGTNYNHTQIRINKVIDWALSNLNVDTNRVYIHGGSLGAPGAFYMAITYPEKFAAASVVDGLFNFGFDNDYQPNCTMNDGKGNRRDGDSVLGKIEDDLPTNLGSGTYEVTNGGLVIHQHNEKNFPFIMSLNGKHDEMMGWTEKTIHYDSVNNNHTGGNYFWDSRQHSGSGGIWSPADLFDLFRFRKDLSFPAFSDCSLNEDWGNGNGNTGENYGSVNGSLDWVNELVDESSQWQAQVFIHDLPYKQGVVVYPDSCTVTITPRRVQRFHPSIGDSIEWSVLHQEIVIQSGKIKYSGGLITVPGIKIFKDTSTITLRNSITATTTPSGNVTICSGTSLIITANGGNGISYQWYKGVGAVSGATNQTYTVKKAGTYYVQETNSFGSPSNSATIIVTVVTKPAATITPLGNLDICQTGFVDLQANPGAGYIYQWMKGTNNLAGATNQTYKATTKGSYKVVVSNSGCSKTSAAVKVTKACKEEFIAGGTSSGTLNCYPNPTDGQFTIDLKLNTAQEVAATIEIINSFGQRVYAGEALITNGELKKVFDATPFLTDGMYFVKVIAGDHMYSSRLTIQK